MQKKFNIKNTYNSSNTNSSNYSMYKSGGSGKCQMGGTHTQKHTPNFAFWHPSHKLP